MAAATVLSTGLELRASWYRRLGTVGIYGAGLTVKLDVDEAERLAAQLSAAAAEARAEEEAAAAEARAEEEAGSS